MYGSVTDVPLSQLPDLIPETGFPTVQSISIGDVIISNSLFAIFHRLPLSALESTYFPTYPELRALIREAKNLSELTLFPGEYGDANLMVMGLKDCTSLRSLFISPEYALTALPGFDTQAHRERLGYASDTDDVHLYDWHVVQALLEAGLPSVRDLSIQIGDRSDSHYPHHLMQCLRAIEWDWLEDYLIDHYPDLESLSFHFTAKTTDKRGVTEQALEDCIREHLPKPQRMGVINVKKAVPFLRQPN